MMDVYLGKKFSQYLPNFPALDQIKIKHFIDHIKNNGFDGLEGRNKSSDNVPYDSPNWLTHVRHAQKYKLWHYHIGIPNYATSPKGDKTSEYILHYIREADFIVLVAMSSHPPFEFPDISDLEYLK